MEFYHLRSFVVVATTKNLTAAAKQLCTTPPAISAHIKSLEEELKTPLFIRSSKGMALTEKGELLLTKAQKTLDSAVEMVNLAAINEDEIIGNFCLTYNQDTSALRMPQMLANLQENLPGINLELRAASSGEAIELLRAGAIDGAYIYGDVPEDLIVLEVKQQKIVTVLPNSMKDEVIEHIIELQKQPWITMGNNCPFDQLLKQKLGDSIHSVVKSPDDGSRLELVSQGLGCSFLELAVAEHAQQLGKLVISPVLTFDIPLYFVVEKKRHSQPVIKALSQEIKILWGIKD